MTIHAGHFRAVSRIFIFLLLVIIAYPLHLFSLKFMNEDNRTQLIRWIYVILRKYVLGFSIRVHGKITKQRSMMYVCNHMSYLDIPVLASVLKASFVSRGDVATWPLFGTFAKLQRTIFVTRTKETAAAEMAQIRERLTAGDRLLMFPEGTSGDGLRLLPFHSTFFATAAPYTDTQGQEQQVTVQPISLVLSELAHLPVGRHQRALYAWFGDMGFEKHFWEALQQPSMTLDIIFHPATTMAAQGDRKALSKYCETMIAEGLSRGLAGRLTYPQPLAFLKPKKA